MRHCALLLASVLALFTSSCRNDTARPSPSSRAAPAPATQPALRVLPARPVRRGPDDARATLDALESRLLAARTVDLHATIRTEGSVVSDLTVTCAVRRPNALRLAIRGTMNGEAVSLSYVSDGTHAGPPGAMRAAPAHLDEAFLIAFARMGLAHDVLSLLDRQGVDGAGGSLATRVTNPVVASAAHVPGAPGHAIHFTVAIDGAPRAEGTLMLGPDGLPTGRHVHVSAPGFDVVDSEAYRSLEIGSGP